MSSEARTLALCNQQLKTATLKTAVFRSMLEEKRLREASLLEEGRLLREENRKLKLKLNALMSQLELEKEYRRLAENSARMVGHV
jgi:uncharacterized membrane protein YcaP (DUF421 family)